MFEIKGDHVSFLIFGLAVSTIASVLFYALLKAWVDAIRDRYSIYEVRRGAESDAREVQNVRAIYSSMKYELERYKKDLAEANEADNLICRLKEIERRIGDRTEFEAKIKKHLKLPAKWNPE